MLRRESRDRRARDRGRTAVAARARGRLGDRRGARCARGGPRGVRAAGRGARDLRAKLTKAEARLDWREPAAALERRVRALNPWPIAETTLDGAQLRIHEAEVVAATTGPVPGTILGADADGHRRHDRRPARSRCCACSCRAGAPSRAADSPTRVRWPAWSSPEHAPAAPRSAPRRRAPSTRSRRAAAASRMRSPRRRRPACRARRRSRSPSAPCAGSSSSTPVSRACSTARARSSILKCARCCSSASTSCSHGATPEHAAVSETVEAARELGRPRAAGLVNALLRRFQRERDAAPRRRARHARGGACAPGMAAARVRARTGRGDWEVDRRRRQCRAADVAARQSRARHARRLSRAARGGGARGGTLRIRAARRCGSREPCDVGALPGFADGDVSVQDAAAQLAPRFRGGRARHARARRLRRARRQGLPPARARPPASRLVALDIDADRATRIASNLARCGLAAQVVVGDARDARGLVGWPAVRPHPARRAVLGHRRHPPPSRHQAAAPAGDIARFAAQQAALLRACLACWRRAAGWSTRVARC